VDNQQLAQKYIATLPQDMLFFKVVLPVTEARSNPEGEMWLSIEASGPEGDKHGSRMSEAALQRMVGYIERGWNGERLPYLDGHYRDLLAAELGTIHNPRLTEDRHLAVSAQLDPENPQSERLYKSILKGRKHGASIAGFVHSFRIEKREDSDEQDFIIDDIEVIEISRTSYPSWRASFTTMLVQNAIPILQAAPMVLPMIERRFNAFGDTPGLIQCEATGEGTWVCKQVKSKSYLLGDRTMEEELLETVDPTASEAEAEVAPEVVVEERSEESDAVGCCEGAAAAAVETETVEEQPIVLRSDLQQKVDAKMMARELAEYIWTTQEMLFKVINDKENMADSRVAEVEDILDDFVSAAKPLAAKLARMGPSPDVGVVWAEKSELTDAHFSRARVDAIQGAMDAVWVEFAELHCLLSKADIAERVEPVVVAAVEPVETVEERTNTVKAAVEQQMSQLRTEFMERIETLQKGHQANVKEMLETVAEITDKPEAPKGAVRTEASPEQRKSSLKQAFYQSVSG